MYCAAKQALTLKKYIRQSAAVWLAALSLPMMIERNFKPGGKISINHKDIKNVMATAHSIDVPMPLTSQLFEIMQYLKVTGHFDEDHAGIVQYFEKLAGVEVKKVNA